MAIWTNNLLNNAVGYRRYKKIIEYAKNQGIDFSVGTQGDAGKLIVLKAEVGGDSIDAVGQAVFQRECPVAITTLL